MAALHRLGVPETERGQEAGARWQPGALQWVPKDSLGGQGASRAQSNGLDRRVAHGRRGARGAHVPYDGAAPPRGGTEAAGGVPRERLDFLLEGAARGEGGGGEGVGKEVEEKKE
eukprot:1748503-Prymnesium_polylepis.1